MNVFTSTTGSDWRWGHRRGSKTAGLHLTAFHFILRLLTSFSKYGNLVTSHIICTDYRVKPQSCWTARLIFIISSLEYIPLKVHGPWWGLLISWQIQNNPCNYSHPSSNCILCMLMPYTIRGCASLLPHWGIHFRPLLFSLTTHPPLSSSFHLEFTLFYSLLFLVYLFIFHHGSMHSSPIMLKIPRFAGHTYSTAFLNGPCFLLTHHSLLLGWWVVWGGDPGGIRDPWSRQNRFHFIRRFASCLNLPWWATHWWRGWWDDSGGWPGWSWLDWLYVMVDINPPMAW